MGASGRITTHVLDISHGKPAMGMNVQLWKRGEDLTPVLLKKDRINSDGRLDEPLLAGEELAAGVYEIVFEAGRYFQEVRGVEPLLFDLIPIRFRVDDEQSHFHVPLLVAPGGYSTYRGS
ncbi:hydroxyisourate hydrolase [Cohnella luojiensis]|uniref:5-hydroxyisourate hydrolase n=1 Tax=Cohnella luojiensis TaxID=652876 RepID=A0A4Y8LYH7_9BACL|nr:hydroxyisourate hydrolase [Cohnella luojiensis]TFE25003.1 hydroxyisourate hydrolase [Cohnella luojiensis]